MIRVGMGGAPYLGAEHLPVAPEVVYQRIAVGAELQAPDVYRVGLLAAPHPRAQTNNGSLLIHFPTFM